jgi:hypothetical protein
MRGGEDEGEEKEEVSKRRRKKNKFSVCCEEAKTHPTATRCENPPKNMNIHTE